MQDVEKTEIRREPDARRQRSRNRTRPLYGFTVLLLIIGVGIALCMTVFFNIETIEIDGESESYTAVEIAAASGVHTGDNLMRVSEEDVQEEVLSELIFIESVTVEKEYPDLIRITVSPSEAAYTLVDDDGTVQISDTGKILQTSEDADDDLPTITGYDPVSLETGTVLESSDSQKSSILESILDIMSEDLTYPITSIDLTDKYDIVLTFDDRMIFSLGNWSELEYKIKLAETVIGELEEDDEGYLTMVGENQISYRDKDAVEQQTTVTTTTVTDEEGNVITDTTTETTAVSAE